MGTATLTPFITDLESVLVVKEPLNLESMLQYFELIFAAAFFLRDNSIRIHQNVLFNDNFQLYYSKIKVGSQVHLLPGRRETSDKNE